MGHAAWCTEPSRHHDQTSSVANGSTGANRRSSVSRASASETRADVVSLYQEVVDALNRELSQFERIKRIAILPAEFTIESGELTPTLKVKRKVVEERWRDAIEALYKEG